MDFFVFLIKKSHILGTSHLQKGHLYATTALEAMLSPATPPTHGPSAHVGQPLASWCLHQQSLGEGMERETPNRATTLRPPAARPLHSSSLAAILETSSSAWQGGRCHLEHGSGLRGSPETDQTQMTENTFIF